MKIRFFFSLLILISGACFGQTSLRIDQIEFEGVTLLEEQDLANILEIDIGDFPDPTRVNRSIKNLESLYATKGYENAVAKSDYVQGQDRQSKKNILILRFTVHEGMPSYIHEVEIVSSNYSQHEDWTRIREQIQQALLFDPGTLWTAELSQNQKRKILEILSKEDFVGAGIRSSETQSVRNKNSDVKANRFVKVRYDIDLSERVRFGFQGNEVFSDSDLQSMIQELRELGLAKNYIEEIEKKITEEYVRVGYGDVKIKVYTFENAEKKQRTVSFRIEENQRYYLDEIRFEGNVQFSEKVLKDKFYEFSSTPLQSGIYIKSEIDQALEKVVEWLRSNGYIFSRIVSTQTHEADRKNEFHVLAYLYEGSQTVVQKIELEGFSFFSEEKVKEILGVHENSSLNLYALTEGIEELKTNYINEGFLDFQYSFQNDAEVVNYTNQNRYAEIKLSALEGTRYRVSEVIVQGLKKTKDFVAKREIVIHGGDFVQNSLIQESEQRLRRLGIFSSIQTKIQDSKTNPLEKDLVFVIREGEPGLVSGGVGFRNDLGVRLFGQGSYSNLFRRNHSLSLDVETNRAVDRTYCYDERCFIEYEAAISYRWPWVFLGDTVFRPRISANKRQYTIFASSTYALSASLEKGITRDLPITGILTYTLERIDQFRAKYAEDEGLLTIGSLTPAIRMDFRDDALNPHRGFFLYSSYEYADPLFAPASEPDIGYSKWIARVDHHFTVWKLKFFSSVRMGFERSNVPPKNPNLEEAELQKDKEGQIPLIKRFALGGVGSLRGFKEQELNLQGVALFGSASFVNYRFQFDFPFIGDLRMGPFIDAANLLQDNSSVRRFFGSHLREGTGVGLRYPTPFGPINFDWGFKISPKAEESQNRFYFSIGVI